MRLRMGLSMYILHVGQITARVSDSVQDLCTIVGSIPGNMGSVMQTYGPHAAT